MKKATVAALIIALAIVTAGAYAALTWGGNSSNTNATPHDGDDDDDGGNNNTTGNTTLTVHFPVNLSADQAKIGLQLSYPGMSQGNTYEWQKPYQFTLYSNLTGNYQGRVLNKIFALKSGEIGDKCLNVISDNRTLVWDLNELQGINHISGDVNTWISNGTNKNVQAFTVIFNRTGEFELIFQAFDLDTGAALTVPLRVGLFNVPVTGTVNVKALGGDGYVTINNRTYYGVLINITNEWNVRYSVYAAYLFMGNRTTNVSAALPVMTFTDQSLATGQSTQFMAFFAITGDPSDLTMEYRDGVSGQVIKVPLG